MLRLLFIIAMFLFPYFGASSSRKRSQSYLSVATLKSKAPEKIARLSKNGWKDLQKDTFGRILSFLYIDDSTGLAGTDKHNNSVFNQVYRFILSTNATEVKEFVFSEEPDGDAVRCMKVLSDGRIIFGSYESHVVGIWDLNKAEDDKRHKVLLRGHKSPVLCVAEVTGDKIVSGSSDLSVRLWDLSKGEDEPGSVEVIATKSSVGDVAGLPDGRVIFRVVNGQVWVTLKREVENDPIATMMLGVDSDHFENLLGLSDGRILLGASDGSLAIYDSISAEGDPKSMLRLEGHTDCVTALAELSGGKFLSGSHNGEVYFWSLNVEGTSYNIVKKLLLHNDEITDFKILTNEANEVALVEYSCRTFCLYSHGRSKIDANCLNVEETDYSRVRRVAVVPGGRIVRGEGNGMFSIYENADEGFFYQTASFTVFVVEVCAHSDFINFLDISHDRRIVTGGNGSRVRLFPTEEYFMKKMTETQDPRDYESDGPGIYDILFGRGALKNSVKQNPEREHILLERK